LHDRGDYKTGWQIDLDWDKQQREKKKQMEIDAFVLANQGDEVVVVDDEDQAADSLDCPVCGCEFKDPVQPACGHVVCEACALKKPGVCRVCGEKTDGVFAASRDVRKRIKEKRVEERAREAEIKARIGNPLEEEEEEKS
jgi:RING finger protein 113A